jgi:hypothetical protein
MQGAPARPSQRPVGIVLLTGALALYAAGAFQGVVLLLPQWLAAAREHRFGSGAFVWVQVVAFVTALAAAFGLWNRRRWARMAFLACMGVTIATSVWIAAFGFMAFGPEAPGPAWLPLAAVLLGLLVAATLLVRYVWRHT